MAIITFRSASDAGSNTGTVNNLNVTLPAGTVAGDLQTIWVGVGVAAPGTPPSVGTPSGWTLAGTSGTIGLIGGTFNVIFKLFYKIADGTDGTVNLANGGGTNSTFSVMRKSYENPSLVTPYAQVSWSAAAGGPDTSPVVTGLTTGANNALIDIAIQQGAAAACTPPGSMTERIDNATFGYACADEVITSAGATGTRTFTLPGSADYMWGIAEFRSAPGQITVQPTSQSSYEGQTATFSITANPTGTPSYQWKDDGANVGTDSNSYTTAAAVFSDNLSQITCEVTDDNGTGVSNAATWAVFMAAKPFYLKA